MLVHGDVGVAGGVLEQGHTIGALLVGDTGRISVVVRLFHFGVLVLHALALIAGAPGGVVLALMLDQFPHAVHLLLHGHGLALELVHELELQATTGFRVNAVLE